MINIDEKWRVEYRVHRYLTDLSDDELRNRGQDAFLNFMTINDAGKASPLPTTHQWHVYWRMRFVHFLEECVLRFGSYPNGLGPQFIIGLKFPNPKSKKVRAAMSAVGREGLEDGKYLVKYGKREHLKQTLHNGIVRISPASSFADPSLNDAVRDTELEFSFLLYKPTHENLRPYLDQPPAEPFILDGSAIITQTAKEDFHLFCLSASYDPRLFDDFDADACLLITKPIEFRDRLLWAIHRAVNARGHSFSTVTYVDPLTETGKDTHLALRKNARYTYQDEVRAVWLPKDRSAPLAVQFVKVGNLEDVARLVVLEN